MSKVKTRTVKKLWKGMYISLRDYEISKAISDGTTLLIKHKGESMRLSPSALKDIDLSIGTITKSMYNNQQYRLIDIRWRADGR